METNEFREIIYAFYEKAGRVFPWRNGATPWGVLVSEFMLQQTQTERVRAYYERFMARWPEPRALYEASLEDALREWSGLGYNRRARFLKDCARIITENKGGVVPQDPKELETLPGIGPYCAGAIACFAYNVPVVFIETNIRSVMLHFFFSERQDVKDREIFPILEETLDREHPRLWYYALMDYGAALKKLKANPNRKSAHYQRQSAFKGSFRQLRGSMMRAFLAQGPGTPGEIFQRMDVQAEEELLYRVLKTMEDDFLVAEEEGVYRIENTEPLPK